MARASAIEKMSLPELRELQAQIADQMVTKEREERDALRAKVHAMAAEAGVDVADLLGGTKRGKAKSNGAAAAAYRNPANPDETWTGRGRRPMWLVEKLKKRGAKLEDFAG